MEAEVIYRAKDGRSFDDPMACQAYEERLGIQPGTIASLVKTLEDRKGFVSGIVVCEHLITTESYGANFGT